MLDLEAIKARFNTAHHADIGSIIESYQDIPDLVSEVERLKLDYAEAMRQYNHQQKRACKAEAEIIYAVTEAREAWEACRQIAEEVALCYSGYGHEAEMNVAIYIANAIKALGDASR